MIDMYSIAYKSVDYPLPSRWIRTIAVGELGRSGEYPLTDRSGESIYHLNKYFGELTAQYWIHRNSKSNNHVGFCHYRRYFNFLFHEKYLANKIFIKPDQNILDYVDSFEQDRAAEEILKIYDLIACRQTILNGSIKQQYIQSHSSKTWELFIESILNNSPSYLSGKIKFFEITNVINFTLMYIMKRELFDEFMEELFAVLMPVFKEVGDLPDIMGERFQPSRYPAYLAERFLMLFLHSKRMKIFEAQIITFENNC